MNRASHIYSPSELKDLPTLCVGQCCSLKIDDGVRRVWLCRVAGGVKIEKYNAKSAAWEVVAGGCDDTGTNPLFDEDQFDKRERRRTCLSVDLRREAYGYCLQFEGQPPVELRGKTFLRLIRQFVVAAHDVREILEPPFVVRLHAQYNVDGDQQTPIFVADWAFGELPMTEEFLADALADVAHFQCRWPFRLWLPVVPELEYFGFSPMESVAQALADFRCLLLEHFFEEAGADFWNQHLTASARIAVWEAVQDRDCNLPVDPAAFEAWAKTGAFLSDENKDQ